MILAVVLSALVLLGWAWLSEQVFPARQSARDQGRERQGQPLPQPQAQPVAELSARLRDRAAVLAATPRVRIETPSARGLDQPQGRADRRLVLLKQRQTIAKNSPPVRLLSPPGTPGAYFASFGWTGQGVAAPDRRHGLDGERPLLAPGKPVTLSWTNPAGQTLRDHRLGRRQLPVHGQAARLNTTGHAGRGAPYRPGQPRRPSRPITDSWTVHVGPIGVFNGKANYDVNWKTLDEDGQWQDVQPRGGWLGFTDKYWLTALAPAGNRDRGELPPVAERRPTRPTMPLAPTDRRRRARRSTTETRLFAGAKEKALLDRYERRRHPQALQVDRLGLVRMVHEPDLQPAATGCSSTVGNFGVAIICLTLIVRG